MTDIFCLQMDHNPLRMIYRSEPGIPTYIANRLHWWGITLLNDLYKMDNLPSKQLGHVDSLSRLILRNNKLLEDSVLEAPRMEVETEKSDVENCA